MARTEPRSGLAFLCDGVRGRTRNDEPEKKLEDDKDTTFSEANVDF